MEQKKPRVLDISRLIVALLVTIAGVLFVVSIVSGTIDLFNGTGEDDTISGLIFIFLIPIFIIGLVFASIGIRWIAKYAKIKNKPLIERNTSIIMPIIVGVVAGIFLQLLSLPIIVYCVMDLIEAIMKNNLKKKFMSMISDIKAKYFVMGYEEDIPKLRG